VGDAPDTPVGRRLLELERELSKRGEDLALFLTFDRPERVDERPGIARTYFAQRCVTDLQINRIVEAFRSVNSYVELLEGELALLEALAERRIQSIPRRWKVLYNGIEGGIGHDGFEPGRKALIPAVADAYGLICANSNAYACALGRHKFHYFTVMSALGLRVPATWHFRPTGGWAGGRRPPHGTKVIAKSTYESWSVGVTQHSTFVVDDSLDDRVSAISEEIGQATTVQEFIAGTEVCVPVFACPEPVVCPPVEAILVRAPGDTDAFTTIEDSLKKGSVEYRRFNAPTPVITELAKNATQAFDGLELSSFARIDFRIDERGDPWVTDVGVSPGLSPNGSAFHSAAALGLDHPAFLRTVVAATLINRDLMAS
jgi:D-alanine-D-alanine ligase